MSVSSSKENKTTQNDSQKETFQNDGKIDKDKKKKLMSLDNFLVYVG